MGKALIIAEKPSVATDISKALGGFKKQDDFYESEHFVLSSAVGHLLQICVPDQYEVKRGKEAFAQAHQTSGRGYPDQRLRRRARRRAHFSLHRSIFQGQESYQTALAAIDDPGGYSRGIRR